MGVSLHWLRHQTLTDVERIAGAAVAASYAGHVSEVRTHVDRTGPLSDLDAIFDELEHGKFLGRAVITDLVR